MFTIYYSNKIDILLNLIKIQIKKFPLKNPLTSEIILYDNYKNFSKLIKINFSNILGIYGNINFISLDKFIWNIFIKIIPNIYKDDFLYKENITWLISLLIPDLIYSTEFTNFTKYFSYKIKDFNYLFQLSTQISNLYNHYQKYKPELLLLWEQNKVLLSLKNKHQTWQAKLWKTLLTYYKNILNKKLWYYGKLYNFYQKYKKYKIFKYDLLPERIFILDIQNIPLIHLKLLKKLEKYIEIHILVCSPSKYYWDNTLKYKNFDNQNINFNTLLFSWGNYHLNNFNKLINLPSRIIETFIENDKTSLLNNIKNDILYIHENNLRFKNKKKINYLDKSIQINICEDFYTEIKLLRNNILFTLKNNQNYFLHDIIVICPNLEIYVPFINSIFKDIIPINVYSNPDKIRNLDILNKFLFLLNLPYKNLIPQEIFFLLDDKYISNKFSLNKENLEYLHYWIKDLGIKYGLNIKNFNDISLPKDQYTWKLGIYRIFLGFSLYKDAGKWKNLIPYNISTVSSQKLLDKFICFLLKLEKWKIKLNKKYFLEKWKKNLLNLYHDFFPENKFIYKNIYFILKKFFLFLDQGLNIKYKKKISIKIIIQKINYLIQQKHQKFLFHINKINFCSFNMFQNMLFKKIFMIGMSNEYFPKKKYPVIFNLIKDYPYKGEKNYLDEDKNLFLKLIISTENKLFISYTNNKMNNIQNNLSNIINKLFLYISKNYYIKNNLIKNCLIKNFYRNYQNRYNFFFKKDNNIIDNYKIHGLKPIKINKLKINNLINFWKHPVKGFFNQRLKIYLQDLNNIKIFCKNSFNISALQEYIINKKILYTLILNKNINHLYNYYLNNGILPYGPYGEIWWEEKIYKINKNFNNKFQKYSYIEKIYKINFKIFNIKLKGNIKYFSYKNNLIKFEPKIIDIKTIIDLWIKYLILCANNINNKKINLFIYGFKNTKYNFKFLTKNKAIFLLEKYINGYISGLNNPILLPMKSSWIWINYCYDKEKKCINNDFFIQDQAKKKFFYYWNKNNIFINEYNDPYFKKLNFYLNKKKWLKTIKLIKKWMIDLLYYSN
ncbi:exodeoxyribonuclease V subunit gamma [Enterobacteriaceae endosymbiont of Donacia sparganii]|uniref:exodeoxyribonuclease V subunit gamma n=1 Tax=Enterobacteriaceae endosymbiont of Donacia sparganii TaxID=2675785 RepID=UPI001449DBD9|nr:exodeoxyribonuclease V subunit gamma [Enterobacteriaceae endosymbiont of Donacia sparganii]QJC35871.1 hypothetical protein GJT98_02065 [Enterobacteriaceae endosymbiont of Donacia sparganii]